MLQKDCYSAKIKFAKTFLPVNPRKFIPSKYTRYTVSGTRYAENKSNVIHSSDSADVPFRQLEINGLAWLFCCMVF